MNKSSFTGSLSVVDNREQKILDALNLIDERYCLFFLSYHTQRLFFERIAGKIKVKTLFPSEKKHSAFLCIQNTIDKIKTMAMANSPNYTELLEQTLRLLNILFYVEQRLPKKRKDTTRKKIAESITFFNEMKRKDQEEAKQFFDPIKNVYKSIGPLAKQGKLVAGYVRECDLNDIAIPKDILNLIGENVGLDKEDNLTTIISAMQAVTAQLERESVLWQWSTSLFGYKKRDQLKFAVEKLKTEVNCRELREKGGTNAAIETLLSYPVVEYIPHKWEKATRSKLSLAQMICKNRYTDGYSETPEFVTFKKRMELQDIEIEQIKEEGSLGGLCSFY